MGSVTDFSTPIDAENESPADISTQYAIIHATANHIGLLSYNFLSIFLPIFFSQKQYVTRSDLAEGGELDAFGGVVIDETELFQSSLVRSST